MKIQQRLRVDAKYDPATDGSNLIHIQRKCRVQPRNPAKRVDRAVILWQRVEEGQVRGNAIERRRKVTPALNLESLLRKVVQRQCEDA
jgi:hypothetical protein